MMMMMMRFVNCMVSIVLLVYDNCSLVVSLLYKLLLLCLYYFKYTTDIKNIKYETINHSITIGAGID